MSSLEEIAVAWLAGRQMDFGSLKLSFLDATDSTIRFRVDHSIIQIIVPPSFQLDGCSSCPIASSGEVFLVTGVGCKSDEHFENMLLALNEKLERISIEPDSLSHVLDHILLALQKYDKLHSGMKGKADRRALESSSCNSTLLDDGYDSEIDDSMSKEVDKLTSGFLYVMAKTARSQCESAQRMFIEKDFISDALEHNVSLAWCHVIPQHKTFTVKLAIHVGGIVRDDNLAAALGISVEFPVKITLVFEQNTWVQRVKKLINPQQVGCKVSQEIPLPSNDLGVFSNRHTQTMSYGNAVLLPKLVGAFFQYLYNDTVMLEEKLRSRQVFDELHQFTSMENTFVGLLCFLCARLKTLQDWCIFCLSSLPYSVCRLRTCDKELCLFTFEEVGVGTPVLQEVQSSPEIVDFELSLALAAAASNRDVFEPFPSFLLQKEQLRARSGWFSKTQRVESSSSVQLAAQLRLAAGENITSFSSNKNMALLKSVLSSIPPIEVMQKCQDEITLRETVSNVWGKKLETDRKSTRPEGEESSHLAKIKLLPFSVLRYILSTSRVQLHCLHHDETLRFFDSLYQFAVLHDNPEREAYFESRRIQQGGSFFAFHGSSADNWYSILRNGLRCLSNTSFMSGGASYGPGIYFSNSSEVSRTFCTSGCGWGHGPLKDGFSVLAICEIINGALGSLPGASPHKMKERGIMVVPPQFEKDVAIRYIIIFGEMYDKRYVHIDGTKMPDGFDFMKHYLSLRSSYGIQQQEQRQARCGKRFEFMLKLSEQRREPEEWKQSNRGGAKDEAKQSQEEHFKAFSSVSVGKELGSSMSVSSISIQAIVREYKNIIKQTNEAKARRANTKDECFPLLAGLEVILAHETNISIWRVNLSQFLFKQFPLYKDLVECARQWNVPEVPIKLECTFPENYPFSPPFVRVISPKFVLHTGHVTVGGSICMELLTASGWSPAYTFESIIVQIVNAMIEGGGRLDKRAMSTHCEYGELEARHAFNRVAREHGWRVE